VVQRCTRGAGKCGTRQRQEVSAREKAIEEVRSAGVALLAGGNDVALEPAPELSERRAGGASRVTQAARIDGDRSIDAFNVEPSDDRVGEQPAGTVALAHRFQPPFVRD